MRYLKLFFMAMIAIASLAAGTPSSSASPLTSPEGTIYTSTINAESDGPLKLHGNYGTVECKKSTVQGKVEAHAGTTASGKISNLTFTECSSPVTVKLAGSLEINAIGNGRGTLTSTGARIEITTSVGTCVYTTNKTDIGTLRDSNLTSGSATLDIDSAAIPRTEGHFNCGPVGTWTGSYKLTTPASLFLSHPSGSPSPLTSPEGTPYTSTLKAESSNSELDGAFVAVKCLGSTAEGKIAYHTSSSAIGGVSLGFTGCNYPVTVLKGGTLSLSTGKGAVTSNGAEISINTSVGTCVFTTKETGIGTLTDSGVTKGNAVLDLGSSIIPRTSGSFLCGSSGTWTGSYKLTTPSTLYMDRSFKLTSPLGTTYTSTIKAGSEGAISLDGKFGTVTCQKSALEAKVESHGSIAAGGKLSAWSLAECSRPVTVEATGSIEIHSVGGGEGTVTSTGAKVSISTLGGTCAFTTSSTDLGTLLGTNITGGNATLDSDFVAIPWTSGSSSCGPNAVLTGSYGVTTPSTLYVD